VENWIKLGKSKGKLFSSRSNQPNKPQRIHSIWGMKHPPNHQPIKVTVKSAFQMQRQMQGPRQNLIFKGYPSVRNMFADSDRDGVPNVFDCQPRNPKKQDWQQKQSKDSVVIQIPVKRLYYQRGRYTMHNIEHPVNIRTSGKEEHQALAEKRAKELTESGYNVTHVGTRKGSGRYDYSGEVKFRRPSKVYNKEIEEQMQPMQSHDIFSGKHKALNPKKYVENIAKAIESEKPKVPMVIQYASHLDKGSSTFGEGRHRILAAKEAGLETIPVEIVQDTSYSTPKQISKLRVQEAKDTLKEEEKEAKPEALQALDPPETSEKMLSTDKDTDGDGVTDSFDCEPDNPDKQGPSHLYMEQIRKRMYPSTRYPRAKSMKEIKEYGDTARGRINKELPKGYKNHIVSGLKRTKIVTPYEVIKTLAKDPSLYAAVKRSGTEIYQGGINTTIENWKAVMKNPNAENIMEAQTTAVATKRIDNQKPVIKMMPLHTLKANISNELKHELVHVGQPEEMREEEKILEKQIGRKLKYTERPREEEAYRQEKGATPKDIAVEEAKAGPQPESLKSLDIEDKPEKKEEFNEELPTAQDIVEES